MFKKILIANRGEIACRVIKTAKKMGIATVAVYSDADKDARHVELADEAVHIGAAAEPRELSAGRPHHRGLQADRAPRRCTRATASCRRTKRSRSKVEEEGIVFIGPKHDSIAAMGDKIASKKLAKEAKVNTIPGWNEAIDIGRARGRDREGHRLPGDDQGQRRRRRQGPARGL